WASGEDGDTLSIRREVGTAPPGAPPAGALLELGRELAAQAVAEVALVDRPAGKLMGNLQGLGRRRRTQARHGDDGWRRQGTDEHVAAAEPHLRPPSRSF